MNSKPEWSEKEERGSSLFFESFFYLYRIGGWRAVKPFMYPVVTYFFLTGGDRRRAIFDYFKRLYSTPEGQDVLGHEPGLRDVYRTYINFGHVNFDRVCLWLGMEDEYDINFPDRDVLRPYLDNDEGVILLSSHVGSFGLMRFGALSKDLNLHIMAYWENSERINKVLKRANPSSQLNIIDLDPGSPDAMLQIKENVEGGDFVAMLGDRKALGSTERVSRVPFLGEEAGFPQGPYLLSYFLECPIILIHCVRTSNREYTIRAEKLTDGVELPRENRADALDEYVRDYARKLEDVCYSAPHQWFNFFDFWE